MTAITIVYTNRTIREFKTNQDYESITFWCREMVEHNDNIKQIVAHFDEGDTIFEAIC